MDKKISWFFHLFVLISVIMFGVIIEKNISLPQVVIRPMGVIALTLIFYGAIFNPIIPFLILVIYISFSRILVGDFGTMTTGINLTNLIIILALFGWAVRSIIRQERFFEKSTLNLPVFLFIIWGILTLIKSSYTYGSAYFESFFIPLKRWLTPVILYFITVNIVKDKRTLKNTVIVMMFVTLIIALMAVKDYLDIRYAGSLEQSRVGGVFEQPNTLGGFFVYNMFLFLGFFFVYFPNFRYFLLLLPFLLCFRGIMVTFSRGAYIGCAFGGLATSFFRNKILFALSVFLLIFALLNPVFLPAGIRNRMSSTYYDQDKVLTIDVEEIKDKSATRRIDIWKGAIAMIKDQPIFGSGYGTFPYVIGAYVPDIPNADAHNTYLILAAEMGIPALLIFLLILFIMIKNSRWLYRKSKDKFVRAFALGMLGCLFGLIVVNMFGSRLNSEEVSAYFWIYAGLIMAAVRMKRKGMIV